MPSANPFMSKYRQRADKNHVLVRNHLKAHGVEVIDILKPLDLLCNYQGDTFFVEVKADDKKEMYTRVQLQFIATTRFDVIFAKTEAEALLAVKTRLYLTETQKNAISGLLLRNTKDYFTSKDLRDILEEGI